MVTELTSANHAVLEEREEALGLYSWLDGARAQPHDSVLAPGVTVADHLSHHRRPAVSPPGSRYLSEVVYGTAGPGGRDLRLYVYARSDTTTPRPGVVLIHGGGWHEMTPFMLMRHAVDLAAAGFVAATVEYRLAPEARWPAQIDDCTTAVRWLRTNHAPLGLDPDRIGVAGNSAGGHLAAMVALGGGRFDAVTGAPPVSSRVQAAALIYPAIDMLHPSTPESLRVGFGHVVGSQDPEQIRQANPPRFVTADCPPVLTVTGDLDDVTPLAAIRDFHAALDRAGVVNELEVYPGRGHCFDLYSWEWPAVRDRLTEFFRRHLETEPVRTTADRRLLPSGAVETS